MFLNLLKAPSVCKLTTEVDFLIMALCGEISSHHQMLSQSSFPNLPQGHVLDINRTWASKIGSDSFLFKLPWLCHVMGLIMEPSLFWKIRTSPNVQWYKPNFRSKLHRCITFAYIKTTAARIACLFRSFGRMKCVRMSGVTLTWTAEREWDVLRWIARGCFN